MPAHFEVRLNAILGLRSKDLCESATTLTHAIEVEESGHGSSESGSLNSWDAIMHVCCKEI